MNPLSLNDLLDGLVPTGDQDAGPDGLMMVVDGQLVNLGEATFEDDVAEQYAKALIAMHQIALDPKNQFDISPFLDQ
jgi:hypothetical protein